ncbi:MAG: hypothetical protein A2X76_00585 [Lysobacterales bacterium GWF1_69_6]|nr:MAG: hypothetical protein A2X76_00585 [Xanthomonadales bacterium GWF1_69_6]
MKKSPPWLIALVLVAGLGIIAGGWWLAERRARENDALAKVQAVLEGFQQGLPREYAPGLMLERVAFEGPALVMTIRALSRSVPEAGDSSEVARAEKALMLPLCDYPDVVFLLSRGVVLKRRFIDSQDRMFFEITLAAADCRR